MSRSRIRIPIVALAFIVFAMAAGVLAIHVSAACEHFVRTYVTKPVRNHVSKATAAAWAKWRIGHPDWKPNPNIHRPKYVMTREEAVKQVAFACAIPIVPTDTDGLLSPDNLLSLKFDNPLPPIVDLPPIETTETMLTDTIPPEVAENPPNNSWPPLAPFVPPILGSPSPGPPIVPPTGPVPEPPSLLLLASGVACLLLLRANATQAEARTA